MWQLQVRSLRCKPIYGDLTLSLAVVLFLYDSFLTFDREVAYFWTAKHISGGALLFFVNKWITMTVYVMSLVSFASFPSDEVRRLSLRLCHGKSDRNH